MLMQINVACRISSRSQEGGGTKVVQIAFSCMLLIWQSMGRPQTTRFRVSVGVSTVSVSFWLCVCVLRGGVGRIERDRVCPSTRQRSRDRRCENERAT